ncbi:MAG: tRNA guanosine(34) transglycosylase Tgt [Elusimicrobiota bacterium]
METKKKLKVSESLTPVFEVTAEDSKCRARSGRLSTPHGVVETPVFMPVATQGSVKALDQEDLAGLGIGAILANSYHLYLRPGADVVESAGGLHKFMNYKGMILTDSGGYQVFSLANLRNLDDDGVTFQSHLDGSKHTLTPESVIRLQSRLGSDIWTALDECPPYPCSAKEARRALDRTMRWAERSLVSYREEVKRHEKRRLFFPILQGSMDPALRREAAKHLTDNIEFDGVCLGGFSVGEEKKLTWETLDATVRHLPEEAPRYLMGMGE